jgi:hypothetical protein
MNLKENMKRFGTKNLNEQEMSFDQKVAKLKSRKKINAEQLKKIIPVGKTATIMTAQEGYLLVVDENNNYYELV